MVGESEKRPIPVNYRRAVNSPVWPMLAFLCVKLGRQPNELLDHLILLAYAEMKGQNEHFSNDSNERKG
jgi:hypothetical protein